MALHMVSVSFNMNAVFKGKVFCFLCTNDHLPIIRVMYGTLQQTTLVLDPMRVMHLPNASKKRKIVIHTY